MSETKLSNKDLGQDNLDWEVFWNQNENQIKAGLAELASDSPRKKSLNLEQMLAREKELAKLILSKVKESLERGENPLMLLDIDHTIGQGQMEKLRYQTIIRPVVPALLKGLESYIKEGQIGIGLLTHRKLLKLQMQGFGALDDIKDYLDKTHIYSSRKFAKSTLSLREGLDLLKDMLGEEQTNLADDEASLSKLTTLADIKKQTPARSLIIVDDLPYVKHLNENNGLHGVYVNETAKFEI